jgi:hypothetical protein
MFQVDFCYSRNFRTFSLFEDHSNSADIFLDQPMSVIEPDNGPVIQIEIVSEAEVFAEMRNRKLDVELNLHNTRASLIQSKISGLSQKVTYIIKTRFLI